MSRTMDDIVFLPSDESLAILPFFPSEFRFASIFIMDPMFPAVPPPVSQPSADVISETKIVDDRRKGPSMARTAKEKR